jgi:hypothetical protein
MELDSTLLYKNGANVSQNTANLGLGPTSEETKACAAPFMGQLRTLACLSTVVCWDQEGYLS